MNRCTQLGSIDNRPNPIEFQGHRTKSRSIYR